MSDYFEDDPEEEGDVYYIPPELLAQATPAEQEAYFTYLVQEAKRRDEWRGWLSTFFPNICTKPFSPGHERFFDWVWTIEHGVRPPPWVSIWSRGFGKALELDTPLPTPTGWTTMGEVQVGDWLLDEQGRPTMVTHTSPVHDKPASEVRFKGGGSVVAADDHDWTALDISARRRMLKQEGGIVDDWYRWKSNGVPRGASPRPAMTRTITTADMAATLMKGRESQWAIPTSKAWDLPKADLPIDPYVLGYWLGDGTTTAGTITVGDEDVDWTAAALEARGREITWHVRPSGYTLQVWDLHGELRANGLLGNKHIPPEYLRGSIEQREDLLAGLCDSDGCAFNGGVEFCSILENLALGVRELAVSLGMRANIYEGRAKLYGKDCGPKWTVRITTSPSRVFHMERKRDSLHKQAMALNSSIHLVKSIESVGTIPVKCVSVDAPSSLFLAGSVAVPTHNSSSVEMAIAALAARDKRSYGVIVCETLEQAEDHVSSVASLLSNPIIEMAYPGLGTPMVDKHGTSRGWRHNRLTTASGFVLDAFGLDSSARGAKFDDKRPDFIVIDDVDGEADSELVTEKKIRAITHKLIPAGSQDCAVLMVQNLVHRNSIFARLCSTGAEGEPEPADWLRDRIVDGPIPAVYNMEVEDIDGRFKIVKGEPAWPDGFPITSCEGVMNDVGLTSFLAEYQHETRPPDGDIFAHLKFVHCEFHELPKIKRTVVWVDPAVSSTESSDSMGVQVDALGADGKIYRLFSWEQRTNPYAAIRKAVEKAIEHKANIIGVETNQGGDTWRMVYDQVVKDLRDEARADGGDWFRKMPRYKEVKASKDTGSKVLRAERMLVDYERNIFVHVLGTHLTLEGALKRFPRVKPYDLVDAAVWSWVELAGPLHRRKSRSKSSAKRQISSGLGPQTLR